MDDKITAEMVLAGCLTASQVGFGPPPSANTVIEIYTAMRRAGGFAGEAAAEGQRDLLQMRITGATERQQKLDGYFLEDKAKLATA